MLRRISTKLVLAVLLAAVLPFVAFAFFLNEQMGDRITRQSVQQTLLGLVNLLSGQVDYFVGECRRDLTEWTGEDLVQYALDNYFTEKSDLLLAKTGEGQPRKGAVIWNAATMARWARGELSLETVDVESPYRASLARDFDRYADLNRVYDLVLLVAKDGHLVTCTSRDPGAGPLSEAFLEYLFAYDYTRCDWFSRARNGEFVAVDHHISPFHLEIANPDAAYDYQLGFAAPVRNSLNKDEVRGVIYSLVNWKYVQDIVSPESIKEFFRGLVKEDSKLSAYAWLWAADADTILAHPDRGLYYLSVSKDLGLSQLTAAVRESSTGWGLYPGYFFNGKDKNAAFHRCNGPNDPDQPGFGWVVGVGINNEDIYATAEAVRALLLGGTAAVLVLATCLTLFIARRTTGPIRELQQRVRRVAEGDLDARIEIRSRDELGALAEDFNRMTGELKAQRERIIKAEKDAAWREMARQIAHDIKNPLTPISLSLDLLERARRERAPGYEEILERTMGLMRRQVENLRQIANDFYEFTGGRKAHPGSVPLAALLDEVLHLHDAWAVERKVAVQREGPDARVWADLGKLRRVFVNLVSNALQAMPEGGELFVATTIEGESVLVTIRDTGKGLAPEARAHLFEPYFTTKTEGTGLGLAIARRSLEELGGEIELLPAPDGPGTVARVRLPLERSPHERGGAGAA